MAKIKQIGGSPNEVPAMAKDILVWFKCLEGKNHPSYLITPYDVTQKRLGCPLCEGRKAIIPYQIRFGVKLNNNDSQAGTFGGTEYFTSIEEAKKEVDKTFKSTIKKMFSDAQHTGLTIVSELNFVSAKYKDGTELVGRMDGTFDGGEFNIEIIKA